MGLRDWFTAIAAAVSNEYERRIRAASEVTEYGLGHNHADHNAIHSDTDADELQEEEIAEIVNIPRGTRLTQPTPSDDKAESATP
jgi:hypothetical protein